MKLNKQFGKPINNFFFRMLLYISVIVAFTISVSSSILYSNFEDITKKLIYNSTRSKLFQASYSVKFLSEYVEVISSQIFSDKVVKRLFSPTPQDSISLNESLINLHSIRTSSPMIHSIYVYNSHSKEVYVSSVSNTDVISTADAFFDKVIGEYLPKLQDVKRFSPIPRRIEVPSSRGGLPESARVFTYIYYDLYSSSNNVENIVFLNVSSNWILNTLKYMDDDVNEVKHTIIVDKEANLVFSSDLSMQTNNLSNEKYISHIFQDPKDSGYFVDEVNGIKSLVTYVKSSYYDWCFISVTPYSSITGSINKLRNITFIISGIILLAGLIITLFVSQRLYKPVKQITSRLSKLEDDKIANMSELKNKFLIALLNGIVHENSQILMEEFETTGNLKLVSRSPMVIILLRIDNYMNFYTSLDYNSRKQVKSKAGMLVQEVFTTMPNFEFIDMGDDKLVLIVNCNTESVSELRENIFEPILAYQRMLNELTGISFSLFISSVGHSYRDIPFLFAEASSISGYRFFYGHKSILFPGDIPETEQVTTIPDYPIQKGKALSEAINLGKLDSAIDIYKQFIQQIGVASAETYQYALSHVFFIIKSAYQNKMNDTNAFSNQFSIFFDKLHKTETLEDVNVIFLELFKQVFSQLLGMKKTKYDDLVNTVKSIIERDYSLNTLSINHIADEVEMSSTYLGKLFKQLYSKSIPDYISEFRLLKAKELLKNTDTSINDISVLTGFTNRSYFYMVFKKEFGITPSQYRQEK